MNLKHEATFIPLALGKYESLDPLDADRSPNLPVMRMLNLTPIEVTVDNRLTSQILSHFSYSPEKATATFVVRKDAFFSDGKPIRAHDIAFSIARMAFTRPKFPVISEISGLEDWLTQKDALASYPSGIEVDDSTILIKFRRDVPNPLFRFCLEIFSIVPKNAIDTRTNTLKYPKPPTSGNYVIHTETENEIEFQLRSSPKAGHELEVPDRIVFKYFKSLNELKQPELFDSNTVMAGHEFSLRTHGIDLESHGYATTWTPASNFAVLLLSPSSAPFTDTTCRRFFMRAFREELALHIGNSSGIEPSLFPVIVPGYLSENQLNLGRQTESEACLATMREVPIRWATYADGQNDLLDSILKRVTDRLGLRHEPPLVVSSFKENESAFKSGQISLLFSRTGFWPLDPIGDVQMLFTPNLHDVLELVWGDPHVPTLIEQLGQDSEPIVLRERMEQLNRYLYAKSTFNPIMHYRRFLVSTGKETIRRVPLAVQQPYPWQIFNVK